MSENKSIFVSIEKRFTDLVDRQTFEKECSFALQHFKKNSYLATATTISKIESVLNVAQTGLTLNPVMKMAYLVPRSVKNDQGQYEVRCILEPSYQGIIKLITDSGSVNTIYAHCVYEGDDFDVTLGTTTNIIHKPRFKSKEIISAYAVANLPDGRMQVDIMSIQDLHEIRSTSEAYKSFEKGKTRSCIWVDYEGEMCKKTVVKRLCKYLPKTDKWEKVAKAIEMTNEDYQCTTGQMNYIESLLVTANMLDDDKAEIERNYDSLSFDAAGKQIAWLKENQLDPIKELGAYSQTDIKEKLNDLP